MGVFSDKYILILQFFAEYPVGWDDEGGIYNLL
jgi:hypothetical protein